MDCAEFKRLRPKHGILPLDRAVWDTPEHEKWGDHFLECQGCSDWELSQRIIDCGEDPNRYPCVHIGQYIAKTNKNNIDPWSEPDILIIKHSGGYGMPIRDGGNSFSEIGYCPWCGNKC